MTGRILLLDSASLYYRAFYGLPDSLKAPDGTVVNALRGLIDFVSRLATDYQPTAIIACWDEDWRPQWRVDLLDTYKTHRLADGSDSAENTPDLLTPQVPLIAEALGLLGVRVVGAPGCEADDVIGTITAGWDGPVDIVTGDRDLFQLVDDAEGVRVLYTARGVVKHDLVNAAWIRERYGIEPQQYVDFAVLRGDPSDGIPGVAGVGDKTAAALLNAHGNLDAIQLAANDDDSDIKPRVRANLLAASDYIGRARQVVTVRPDAFVLDSFTREPLNDRQKAHFEAFGSTWGLGGVVGRALTALA